MRAVSWQAYQIFKSIFEYYGAEGMQVKRALEAAPGDGTRRPTQRAVAGFSRERRYRY